MKTKLLYIVLFIIILNTNLPVYASASQSTVTVSVSDDETIITDRIIYAALKKLGYKPIISRMKRQTAIDSVKNGDSNVFVTRTSALEPLDVNLIKVYAAPTTYTYVNNKFASLATQISQVYSEMEQDTTLDKIENQENLSKTDEKMVLHISSFSSETAWEEQTIEGVKQGITDYQKTVYHNFPLDLKRIQDKDFQKLAVSNLIRTCILERVPDVVIVSDNDAFDFVNEYFSRLFIDIPVVMCGINDYTPEIIDKIKDHTTGVYEQVAADFTINEMLEIYPKTKKILVVNDKTTSGLKWQHYIEDDLKNFKTHVEFLYNENVPFATLLKQVESLDDDTLVLLGSYFTDSNGVYATEAEVTKALHSVAKKPIFCLVSTFIGSGAFGGNVVDGYSQGLAAGQIAAKILNGTKISDIPVIEHAETLNKWKFDYNIAYQFNISDSHLPKDFEGFNKRKNFWELYPTQTAIAASCIFFVLLISGILLEFSLRLRRRNNQLIEIQKSLHSAEELLEKDLIINEVKERLEKTIGNAPVGYVLSIDGAIIETNEMMKNKIGASVGSLMRDVYESPKQRDEIQHQLDGKQKVQGQIAKLKMKNGEYHRFHIDFNEVEYEKQKAFAAWTVDIEESERQKDAIRMAEVCLQRVLDTLPLPMLIISSDSYEVIYQNLSSSELFDIDVLKAEISGFANHYIQNKKSENTNVDFEYDYNSLSDNRISLQVFASEIVYHGQDSCIFICQDISKQKLQENYLRSAAEKERDANHLKSSFLANMSHEIRTPMNAIIGLTQVALLKKQTAENDDLLKKVNFSAKNLLSIINDILDFSKIEAEKLDFINEDFSLEEVISNAFLIGVDRIESKQIEILLDLAADVPWFLYGDKTRLWQILKNLIDNAAKYTEKGRIFLKVSLNQSKSNAEKATLIFEINDTGVGMGDHQLERLFNPFEQFHNNEFKNKKAGTGLGMSITKQLVELLDGTIEVESTQGVGTSVRVEISYGRTDASTTTKQMIQDLLTIHKTAISPVLVADDDELCQSIVSSILDLGDIEVISVATGEDALKKVMEANEANKPFKIIILDYLLGNSNGLELGDRLKSISPSSKLFMMTAYAKRLLDAKKIIQVGFSDIIEKPFTISSFIEKLTFSYNQDTEKPPSEYPQLEGRLLVCEDNFINQDVAESMLEVFGLTPIFANNGQEGIDRLEKETFDLVLMDIIMPVMDGHEATQTIRNSNKPYSNIPIVAMTANVMSDEVERCIVEGMNGHIEKPISFENLQGYLEKFLKAK